MPNPDLERVRNPDFPAMAKSGLRTYTQVPNPDFTPRSPGYGPAHKEFAADPLGAAPARLDEQWM